MMTHCANCGDTVPIGKPHKVGECGTECDLCREMAPLGCDMHAELRALERQGYLDALDLFEESTVATMMDVSTRLRTELDTLYGKWPNLFAYRKGKKDGVDELIAAKIE